MSTLDATGIIGMYINPPSSGLRQATTPGVAVQLRGNIH